MSRTFKTNPPMVQLSGKNPHVTPEEHHDHVNGECDLPALSEIAHGEFPRTRCYWGFKYDGRNFSCGCAQCTGAPWKRQQRRQDRHDMKNVLRKTLNENMEDAEGF